MTLYKTLPQRTHNYMPRFLPIIGLEIHVRLKTQTKMFCGCPNVDDKAAPNIAICSVCTGQPGALPAVNAEAVRLGVKTGLALHCTIPDRARFDRKNYFYPDLPKGYQISQYDAPIAEHGHVTFEVPDAQALREIVTVGITRAHLEEDAAKNIHDASSHSTVVDFNRASVPLVEIVTEPDFRAPQEAKAFLQELQAILRRIGASDADMEKGYMRCDANISLLPVDENNHPLQREYNPKIEIKNINSFRAVERALEYEIKRQTDLYEAGATVKGATRGWNEHTGETVEQRDKETSADYRYFPEPDLPELILTDIRENLTGRLPELPLASRIRLCEEWGFRVEDARFFVGQPTLAQYAEDVMIELKTWILSSDQKSAEDGEVAFTQNKELYAKLVGGWLRNKLMGILADQHKTFDDVDITAENFAEFIFLIHKGTVNSANGLKLLELMLVNKDSDPSHILEEHHLGQSEDPTLVRDTVTRLISENPDKVAEIKAGKLPLLKWFVGCVMKVTEGRANPTAAEEEIKKQIGV